MAYSAAQILTLKRQFVDIANTVCPGFQIEPSLKPTINALFRWCLRLDGELDPDKGLWLHGSIGSGKTTMLQIVRAFAAHVRPAPDGCNCYWPRITKAFDVCAAYEKEGTEGIRPYFTEPLQAFDDLGFGNRLVNHYGTACNVFSEVLAQRYDRCLGYPCETHVTTNLTLAQIPELFDERIADRCNQMFNFVEFSTYSWRS